jgi:hypothetical protein
MWILHAMANLATQGVSVRDDPALESRSGGEAIVAMVRPADFRNRDYLRAVWRLDGASTLPVLGERQMGARAAMVIDIRAQDAALIALVNREYMIQALAANRADDWFDMGSLPRRSRRRNDLCDSHDPNPLPKASSVRRVAVEQQIAWRDVLRTGT